MPGINCDLTLWAVERIVRSSGPLPERLANAWDHISKIKTKELPERCRGTFEWIRQDMERVATLDDFQCGEIALHFVWLYCQYFAVKEVENLIKEGLPRGCMRVLKDAGLIEPLPPKPRNKNQQELPIA